MTSKKTHLEGERLDESMSESLVSGYQLNKTQSVVVYTGGRTDSVVRASDLKRLFNTDSSRQIKDFCIQWQYKDSSSGLFFNHSDVKCMIYNIYFHQYRNNKENFEFQIAESTVNFRDMKETV